MKNKKIVLENPLPFYIRSNPRRRVPNAGRNLATNSATIVDGVLALLNAGRPATETTEAGAEATRSVLVHHPHLAPSRPTAAQRKMTLDKNAKVSWNYEPVCAL